MLMTRWDPFADMAAMTRRVDRMFADVFGSPVTYPKRCGRGGRIRTLGPRFWSLGPGVDRVR